MAYSIEIKNEVIKRIAKGEKLKDIGEKMEISLSTIYKWKKELQPDNEKIGSDLIVAKKASKDIKKLIKLRKFDEALRYTDKYSFDPIIQSQKIKIYIETRRYKEAKEIGKKFKEDALIQSQMITIAIEEENFETAKEIGKRFKEDAPIQSQMITVAIKEGDFETAKEIGERFKDNETIQSQMITVAIKEGDFETAKEIGKRFKDNETIQSQMITVAIKEGDFETAKEIGERFKDYAPIQSQMITVAIKEGDFETAKEIGERFKDNTIIQEQMKKIEKMEQLKDYNTLLNEIKTKMYYEIEKIDIQEILQNKQLTEKQKLYIVLAIYERDKNIKEIKELVKQYKESEEIKNINIILQRAQCKKKRIFDWEIYDDILGWKLDKQLKSGYDSKIKEQEANKDKQREEEKRKQEIQEEKQIKSKDNSKKQNLKRKINFSTKENTNNVNLQEAQIQHRKNRDFKQELKLQVQQEPVEINNQNKKKQFAKYYQEVLNFLLEKKKTIYVKMQSSDLCIQREGIEQWDKLEKIIEKTKEQKENIKYISALYQKVTKLKEIEEGQIGR